MAYIELSKKNYFHNLTLLSKKAGGVDKLSVVLKDNAYGHGLKEMAKMANEFGIKKAVVRDDREAKIIENLFDMILVLMPKPDSLFSQVINSLDQLKATDKYSKIHLKIDSGMHRNGIDEEEITEALELVDHKDIVLEGVMTHFRSADDLNSELFWQMKNWERIKKRFYDLTSQNPLFHSFASSSLLRSDMSDDFARCGIATYGYSELDSSFGEFDLKPVLNLYAEKICTKKLKPSQRVGYGGVGLVDQDMTVSTYDIGYGDGFFRYDGEGKYELDGKKIIGRISMDSMSVRSDKPTIMLIPDAKEIATKFNTISYDILVKLSPFIKRIIL